MQGFHEGYDTSLTILANNQILRIELKGLFTELEHCNKMLNPILLITKNVKGLGYHQLLINNAYKESCFPIHSSNPTSIVWSLF